MTDHDPMIAAIQARQAQVRQQRDAVLVNLGRCDGMIAALEEVLAGLTAPPIAPADAPATEEKPDASAT